jgi:hypothetical protein
MSWRMTLTSSGSLVEVCSFSRAGMLFWPTYLVISTVSGSTRRIRQAADDRTLPTGGQHTIRTDGLASFVALAAGLLLIGRMRSLFGLRVGVGEGTALTSSGTVGFVRAELGVFPLDAVLAGALVVAFHLSLATGPACGACRSVSRRHDYLVPGALDNYTSGRWGDAAVGKMPRDRQSPGGSRAAGERDVWWVFGHASQTTQPDGGSGAG